MKRLLYILCILACLPCATFAKKKVSVKPMSDKEIVRDQELKYYFYEAIQMFETGKYAEAMALFMHCEEIDPKDAATADYLARMYTGAGHQDIAEAYTQKAYELAPADYWEHYAYQLFQHRQPKQALQVVKQKLKQDPECGDAAELLQKMYKALGDYRKALKTQTTIDKIKGEDIYSVMTRYQIYQEMGKNKQAIQALENYLKKDPYDEYIQVFLGDVYYAIGEEKKAMEQYAKIEKDFPDNPFLPVSLSEYWITKQDTAQATRYVWQVMTGTEMMASQKLNVLGDSQWLTTEEKGAMLEYLVKQYPQEEEVLVEMEKHYKALNMANETRELCRTIVTINPDNKEAWLDLALSTIIDSTCTFSAKDSVLLAATSHMTEEDAVNRLVLNSLRGDMLTLEYMKDTTRRDLLEQGFACYEVVLQLDPNNAATQNNYAYFLAITGGDLRKAERMSQASLRQDPHNATYLDTYAWILHLQGEAMLAQMYMRQAMNYAEDKENPEFKMHYQVIIGE